MPNETHDAPTGQSPRLREGGPLLPPRVMIQLRRLCQLLFLGLFVYLFASATQERAKHALLPVDLFLRADPLVALMTMLSTREMLAHMVLPSLLVVGTTLVLGRVFCGWVCPLGTALDLFDRVFLRVRKLSHKTQRSDTRRYRKLKYYVLLGALAAALGGLQFTYPVDPISLLTRTLATCVLAPGQLAWNALLGLLGGEEGVRFGLKFYEHTVAPLHFRQTAVVFLTIVAILALSSYQERFWCRNLCPLGGLLALLSRVSFLRHRIAEGCTHCRMCELQSRMGAYENTAKKVEAETSHQVAECIHCYRCTTVCPEGVIDAKLALPRRQTDRLPQQPLALSRRRALGSAALGVGWLAATKVGSATEYRSDRCIRPPGALPEEQFLQACTRCAECVRACPTNALQPALTEAGLEGWMTPILVPKIGPCVEHCTVCGEICPTDALRRFTIKQKREDIRLGLAVVSQSTCWAFHDGRDCIVCQEVCSYGAVEFVDLWDDLLGKKKRVPVVDREKCTGCGICEKECPVAPEHAIVVRVLRDNRRYNAPRPNVWGGFTQR